ncbi:MAG TPA: L,D-transpeptidase [Aestuariivirgaceae bacterium]|jgi:lipoprotein-anchoring transpeptidase ErfK/SrfK
MDRRLFLLSGMAALVATPASARWRTGNSRFNFNLGFRSKYKGKSIVPYRTAEKPGTIVISTRKRRLFYVLDDGTAISYGIGVGRFGFTWRGVATVGRKAEWPRWIPPAEMVERDPLAAKYAEGMPGGPDNPLGARAMYLYQGQQDTLYRIHGTREPWSIGLAVSSGCIRMLNDEVIDLYNRVKIGTKVIVS